MAVEVSTKIIEVIKKALTPFSPDPYKTPFIFLDGKPVTLADLDYSAHSNFLQMPRGEKHEWNGVAVFHFTEDPTQKQGYSIHGWLRKDGVQYDIMYLTKLE
jgi:hypothetical protein